MLGEADGAVDVAAGAPGAAGAIAYDGNVLEMREVLERASCECYGVVRAEYERLLIPVTSG